PADPSRQQLVIALKAARRQHHGRRRDRRAAPARHRANPDAGHAAIVAELDPLERGRGPDFTAGRFDQALHVRRERRGVEAAADLLLPAEGVDPGDAPGFEPRDAWRQVLDELALPRTVAARDV